MSQLRHYVNRRNVQAAVCQVWPIFFGGRKHFLFTWSENFSLEDPAPLLDNVYISARTARMDQRHPLVPPPPLEPKPVE